MMESQQSVLSAGLGVVIPTATSLDVGMVDGTPLVSISNDAVHLMPFLGGIHSPTEQFFLQGFIQLDFDANGNRLRINSDGTYLRDAGRINDVTYLYLDFGAGWRLFDDPDSESGLTAITPTLEMHYNRSLQDTDVISSGSFQIGNFSENIEIFNMVLGSTFRFGTRSFLTVGYSTPLGGGTDRQFDGELRVLFNRNR